MKPRRVIWNITNDRRVTYGYRDRGWDVGAPPPPLLHLLDRRSRHQSHEQDIVERFVLPPVLAAPREPYRAAVVALAAAPARLA